jgi:hypothetical protein
MNRISSNIVLIFARLTSAALRAISTNRPMKKTTITTLLALTIGGLITSCVDPYYSGGPHHGGGHGHGHGNTPKPQPKPLPKPYPKPQPKPLPKPYPQPKPLPKPYLEPKPKPHYTPKPPPKNLPKPQEKPKEFNSDKLPRPIPRKF